MKLFCLNLHESHRTFLGDAGDWTQDLIHAKHALYHWATSPLNESLFRFCRFKNTINPVVGNYQDMSEIILLKFAWKSLNNNKCLEKLGIDPRTSYMRSMRSTTELHPLLRKVLSASVGFQNHLIQNLQQRLVICFLKFAWNTLTKLGDAGDWTQDLIHAKHALYHWATSPLSESLFLLL